MEDSLSKSPKQEEEAEAPGRGGGWGGWDFSSFSVLSDLQKAATVAAQEISRNAVEVARTAAKSITAMQNVAEDSESSKEGDREESAVEGEDEDEDEFDNQRKAAFDKLEKGLKVLDSSVENFTSGAWQVLGSALRGGSNFVQKFEHSAENLAESVQHGGRVAPSIIESGKAFTARGMHVLQLVGKETMDLLITETGIGVGKNLKGVHLQDDEEQSFEEVTFDRCFYIYGGPEQLERLSEMSCFALSQLLMLGKSNISNANKVCDEDLDAHMLNIDWPEDSGKRAKIIRTRAQSMTGNVEIVCNGFITGITDVAEAYIAAIKGATVDSQVLPQKSIQEKANAFSKTLCSDLTTAMGKIQDGLRYLSYVVLSTLIPAA
ncbi:hypothetical protein ACSBR2_001829 [Camellia fascicularis]